MKRKLFILLSIWIFILYPLFAVSEELYLEGRGTHLDNLSFSLGYSKTFGFYLKLGGTYRSRINDRVDLGFSVNYFNQSVFTEGIDPIQFREVDRGLTLGPVAGYTKLFSNSRWGIRSSIALLATFSSNSYGTRWSATKLSSYGGNLEIILFRIFNLNSATIAFPGIGIHYSKTVFTNKYMINRTSYPFSSIIFQVPISFKMSENTRIAIAPTYWLESIQWRRSEGIKFFGSFKVGFRISF